MRHLATAISKSLINNLPIMHLVTVQYVIILPLQHPRLVCNLPFDELHHNIILPSDIEAVNAGFRV